MRLTQLLQTQQAHNQGEAGTGTSSAYLGKQVQADMARLTPVIQDELRRKVKMLQSAKKRMISQRLGTRNYEHPSFDSIDFRDEKSIHVFLARENIKCALICDPFQSLEQLEMLCDIIEGIYPLDTLYPHVSIFAGYTEAKNRGDSREDLVTYFKIQLLPVQQEGGEKEKVVEELRGIIEQ